MDLDAFVTEHGAEWNRLQQLTGRRRRKLSTAEIDEMMVLYRRAATHLSVVRSRSGDPTLVAWLSRLVLAARAAVTPSSGFTVAAAVRFVTVAFPLAVHRASAWWAGVAAAFVALSGTIMTMVAGDEQVALAFLSPGEIDQLVKNDFEAYYSTYAPQNFAGLVWTNNAFVSAVCLAGGALVVPTLYLLWTNALNVGVIGGVMIANDRADTFFGLILVHGLLELTCVFIAAGAGLRIAWAWIAPGPALTRAASLAQAGRSGMVVALGLVLPLFVSGLIEAFITPSPLIPPVKIGIGATIWLLFLGYIVVFGAKAAAEGHDADVAAHERAATVRTT